MCYYNKKRWVFNDYFALTESELTVEEIKDLLASDLINEKQIEELTAWLNLEEDFLIDSDLYNSVVETLAAEEDVIEENEDNIEEDEIFFLDENFEELENLDEITEEQEVYVYMTEKVFNELEEDVIEGMEEIDEEKYHLKLIDVASKKWNGTSARNIFEKKKKVAGYLVSRGFESNLIWDTLNNLEHDN